MESIKRIFILFITTVMMIVMPTCVLTEAADSTWDDYAVFEVTEEVTEVTTVEAVVEDDAFPFGGFNNSRTAGSSSGNGVYITIIICLTIMNMGLTVALICLAARKNR